MEITQEFVEKHIKEILERLRPDLCFEYFSKGGIGSFGRYSGWDIQIDSDSETLGKYHNRNCISGKWFDEKVEQTNMQELHKKLKRESIEKKIDFGLYLNQLLCKGKQNGGISWNEHDNLIDIDKGLLRIA